MYVLNLLDFVISFSALLVGIFLIHNGLQKILQGKKTIPLNDRIGLWIIRITMGDEAATAKKDKLLRSKHQKKYGVSYLIVGIALLANAIFSIVKLISKFNL